MALTDNETKAHQVTSFISVIIYGVLCKMGFCGRHINSKSCHVACDFGFSGIPRGGSKALIFSGA